MEDEEEQEEEVSGAGAGAACRACLQREGELNIFSAADTLHKLLALAPLQIQKNDGLPDKICPQCMDNLNLAYSFRQQCMDSDLNLRQIYLKEDKEIKCEFDPSDHEPIAALLPKIIKKEPIEYSSNVSDLLEKIGLSGEINIKPLTKSSKKINSKNTKNTKKRKAKGTINNNNNNNKELNVEMVKVEVEKEETDAPVIEIENSDQDFNGEDSLCVDKRYEPKEIYNTVEDDTTYNCEFCEGLTFTSDEERDNHVTMHKNERYDCEICKKNVKGRYRIEVHKQTHVKMKMACEYCGKMFNKDNIRRHLRVHRNAVLKECPICHKMLSPVYINNHVKRHTGNKRYKCDICSASFHYHNSFSGHMRTHTGEKPFKCNFCDSAFTLLTTRVEHERIHTGVTPFYCPVCDRGYAQRGNMKSHFDHNHKELDYKEEVKKAKDRADLAKSKL